jgi:hypothetical protein
MATIVLSKEEVTLIRAALDTHEEQQLGPDQTEDLARVEAARRKLEGFEAGVLALDGNEAYEIAEALDSHAYWEVSAPEYRDSGYVLGPGSDDPEAGAQLVEIEKLTARIAAAGSV